MSTLLPVTTLKDILGTTWRWWHRLNWCGPGRQPTQHEADEVRIWVCPRCGLGYYADTSPSGKRFWRVLDD